MIPAAHRLNLRQHPDFFDQAKRFYSPAMTIFYQSSEGDSQFTVIVPKKKVKLRVMRNLIKRRVSHQFLPMIRENPGLKLVISVNEGPTKLSRVKIQQILSKFTQEAVGV